MLHQYTKRTLTTDLSQPTSVTCQIIEHIYSQDINHLESNGILTDKQFGFRKRRSCETQLLITVQYLAQGLRDKQQIDAVILNFSKAFDKVSHIHLLLKLEQYGVRGPTSTIMDSRLPDQPHAESHARGDTVRGSSRDIRGSPRLCTRPPIIYLLY